jgi:osmotically-inducible protein OsmY
LQIIKPVSKTDQFIGGWHLELAKPGVDPTGSATPTVKWMSPVDQALNERVFTALERSPYLSHRNLRFENSNGRVTIRGVVNSYYQKQMAQEVLRRVDGVAHITNELEVAWA